jgi:hypothetical protein
MDEVAGPSMGTPVGTGCLVAVVRLVVVAAPLFLVQVCRDSVSEVRRAKVAPKNQRKP